MTLTNALLNGGALYLLGRTIKELRNLVDIACEVKEITENGSSGVE